MRSNDGVVASDVIRSMMRLGFVRDEIYDVLAGLGLPGEQVQLLIDRVAVEFYEIKLEPQPSRLAVEVTSVFEKALAGLQHTLLTQIDSIPRELESVKLELEKLGMRVVELQALLARADVNTSSNSGRAHRQKS